VKNIRANIVLGTLCVVSSGCDGDPHTYVHLTFQNRTRGTKTWPCPPFWIILEAYRSLKVSLSHTHTHAHTALFSVLLGAWRKGRCFHFIFINHSYISQRPSLENQPLVFILRFQMYFLIHITDVMPLPVTLSQLSGLTS